MLYNPPAFKVEELGLLHDQIEATGLAMLVSVGEAGPLVSQIPLLLERDGGPLGTLIGHLARGNPQIALSRPEVPALALFQGPDAYVSPTWYPAKREHGKVVPTWNYTVVHARGRLAFFDDRERLRGVVDRLTTRHEARLPRPWATGDAPADYIAMQLKGIIGVELVIEAIEGKSKLSQNRSAADQAGVVEGLDAGTDAAQREVARLMAENLAREPG